MKVCRHLPTKTFGVSLRPSGNPGEHRCEFMHLKPCQLFCLSEKKQLGRYFENLAFQTCTEIANLSLYVNLIRLNLKHQNI